MRDLCKLLLRRVPRVSSSSARRTLPRSACTRRSGCGASLRTAASSSDGRRSHRARLRQLRRRRLRAVARGARRERGAGVRVDGRGVGARRAQVRHGVVVRRRSQRADDRRLGARAAAGRAQADEQGLPSGARGRRRRPRAGARPARRSGEPRAPRRRTHRRLSDPRARSRDAAAATLSALGELVARRRRSARSASRTSTRRTSPRPFRLAPIAVVQNEYSLLARDAEDDVLPLCAEHGIEFQAFSPLAGGWLTGKYARDAAYPAGSRMTLRPDPYAEFVRAGGLRRDRGARAPRRSGDARARVGAREPATSARSSSGRDGRRISRPRGRRSTSRSTGTN